MPGDVLALVLDLGTRLNTPVVPAKRRTAGLSLRATDLEWSRTVEGGHEVSGPAEDLLLIAGVRPAGLSGLRGDGVGVLAERIGAAAPVT